MNLFIFSVCLILINTDAQNYIDSPCPSVFQHEIEDDIYYGIIKIKSPSINSCMVLEVKMSTNSQINNNFKTNIILVGSREKLLQQIIESRLLTYKIDYPYRVIPDIDYIVFNEEVICGPFNYAGFNSTYRKRTNLSAKHTMLANDKNLSLQYPIKNICNENITSNLDLYALKPGKTDNYDFISSFQDSCGYNSVNHSLEARETKPYDWPWLVVIYHNQIHSLDFLCTGTLISDRHIITAASCFKSKMNTELLPSDITLNLGLYDIEKFIDGNNIIASVINIYIHPFYDGGLGLMHDVAIIVIKPIRFSSYIRPICLSNMFHYDDFRMISGWSENDKLRKIYKTTPVQRQIQLIKNCEIYFPNFASYLSLDSLCGYIQNNNLNDTKNQITFSHGSGLYMLTTNKRWILHGVLSFNLHNKTNKNSLEFNIFPNLVEYLTWINRAINIDVKK